ncbi:hypothetical protein EDC04DRAFT_3098693 [Pisolithus marmoratus]|nr:hypothetical protein EDC04DRAFT_3098693 [Pisolithus marmoratus]
MSNGLRNSGEDDKNLQIGCNTFIKSYGADQAHGRLALYPLAAPQSTCGLHNKVARFPAQYPVPRGKEEDYHTIRVPHLIATPRTTDTSSHAGLRQETVDEHKEFSGMAMGKELMGALKERAEEYDTKLQELHTGLWPSTRDKDEQERQVAQDNLQKKRKEIEKHQKSYEKHGKTFKDEKARLLAIIVEC